jgi:hypothetical protein
MPAFPHEGKVFAIPSRRGTLYILPDFREN